MVNILADIHIAEAQLTQIGYRPNIAEFRSAYLLDVLLKNSIDTSRYNLSFEYYSQKPELFANMYDEVLIQIREKQAAVEAGSILNRK
jgi:hypothetical protein